jgi:hypothetical protein
VYFITRSVSGFPDSAFNQDMSANGEWRVNWTRRCWIAIAGAATLNILFESKAIAAEFWDKKEPSDWTSEEVVLLTTKSPWAKDTRVDRRSKGRGAAGEKPEIDPTVDPANQGGRGFRNTTMNTQGKSSSVTVTWESAQPIFDALKYPMPAEFGDHYVIGVKDLPIIVEGGPRRLTQQQLLDWLKNSATLQAKSRDPVQAGVVVPARGGSMLLFGFLKELLPLTRRDREVLFTLDTDQLVIKAGFDPKDMIYRGKLAL